jgi:hypothetical protein
MCAKSAPTLQSLGIRSVWPPISREDCCGDYTANLEAISNLLAQARTEIANHLSEKKELEFQNVYLKKDLADTQRWLDLANKELRNIHQSVVASSESPHS